MALMLDANFYIAVIVAAIVSFILGGIWYQPLFGKAWMAALGKTEADKEAMRKQAPKGFVAGLIGAFISSFVLALFLEYGRLANVGLPSGVAGGLVVGFLVWFGFLMTTTVAGAIFEGRSRKLVGINVGFTFVSYLAMGLILGIWIV
ncbi:MAG TPA: DUF1761 domain-containing protein [Thermoplasmata archaeon]|nr:DUF1761 domain-containing protein [Thermoplasmata archaeon]